MSIKATRYVSREWAITQLICALPTLKDEQLADLLDSLSGSVFSIMDNFIVNIYGEE